jgi:hypothetical protein
MLCCAPFVLFLRRVWVDGAQRRRKNIHCCQYHFSMPMCLCRDHDEKWKQWKIYPTLILLFAGIVKPLCFKAANGLKDMLDAISSCSSVWSNDIFSILHLHGGNKIMSRSFMLS